VSTAPPVLHIYVPCNLGICAISRLRSAFSESGNCTPILRLRKFLDYVEHIQYMVLPTLVVCEYHWRSNFIQQGGSWILQSLILPHWTPYHPVLLTTSLIPRPFPPPVFDRLQYANTEGGRPERSRHVRLRQVDLSKKSMQSTFISWLICAAEIDFTTVEIDFYNRRKYMNIVKL